MFWIIVVIFVLVAFSFVLPPLLRKSNPFKDAGRAQNIFIANEQLADLEKRFEKGEIDKGAYKATKDELEQSLFSDLKNGSAIEIIESENAKSPLFGAAFVALLIPAIAIPVYLKVGDLVFSTTLDSKQAARQELQKDIPKTADGKPDIDAMLARLESKMEANPEKVKGWVMLGRSYSTLGRYADATKSYEKAYALLPESADILLSLADSLAMSAQGQIVGRPSELINKALVLEPNNTMALWLGGMAARQKNNYLTAIERWNKVLPMVTNANEREEVISLISEAKTQLTPQQLGQLDAQTVVKQSVSNLLNEITVLVSLADSLKDKVKPSDTVFIYAKAQSGPPMPLAAMKILVKDLPVEVKLNDQSAMMPNMKLSLFPIVIVGARVSLSGQPIAQDGDLFTENKAVKLGEKVRLEINAVVKK